MTSNFSSAWFVGEESILSVDPGKALGVEGRTKGSLRAYSHLPCLVRTKPKKSQVQTFWAGVNTNNQTLVRTKQPVRDPAGEVVSVRFPSNPGAVHLRCDCDSARFDPVEIICLIGRNRLPLLLVYSFILFE